MYMIPLSGILSPALKNLPKNRYENIFNLYETQKDSVKYYHYNLGKKITIDIANVDPSVFKYIKINRRLPWTTLSYQEYRTQHLWWVILAVNNIINPVNLPKIGDVLRIVKNEYIDSIVTQIGK
jgi:hypothetical protein